MVSGRVATVREERHFSARYALRRSFGKVNYHVLVSLRALGKAWLAERSVKVRFRDETDADKAFAYYERRNVSDSQELAQERLAGWDNRKNPNWLEVRCREYLRRRASDYTNVRREADLRSEA